MAQTGYTPIYLYYSGTATHIPLAANLGNGELAINAADGNLFYKNTSNAVVTVPVLQSSSTQSGWLSSTDWTTFNNKQPAGTYVTSVSGTAPVVSSGGTTPAISMAAANGSTNGYLTSTDWTTFNSKQPAGSYALTTGTLAQFASTTSAQLAGVISDETGSGSLVFGTSPTLTTPTISGNSTISAGNEYFDYGYGIKVKLAGSDIGYVLQEYYGGSYNILAVGPAVGAGGYGYTYLNYANNGTVYNGAQLTQNGDFSVVSGNLVIGTSGKGIDFSATPQPSGMTSELLADYEEGTWTPVVIGTTTAGTGTYSVQSGTYTKIGRMVYYSMQVVWSAHTGTGNMQVTGLPYTVGITATAICNASNLTFPNNLVFSPYAGGTALIPFTYSTNAGNAFLALDTGANITVSGTYSV